MVKRYKSEAFAAIHETMEALHEIDAVDKKTMREFDEACLTSVRVLSPEEIKLIRLRENLSQPVFALYLNVSKNLVSDWERGVKKPGGPALRLLTVVDKKECRRLRRVRWGSSFPYCRYWGKRETGDRRLEDQRSDVSADFLLNGSF